MGSDPAFGALVGSLRRQEFAQDGTLPGSGRESVTGHLGKAVASTHVSRDPEVWSLGADNKHVSVCAQMRSRGTLFWS